MSKGIRIVRPNLGNPLILEPNGLKQFEITVAYIHEWGADESDVPFFSTERVKELLEQNHPRIMWNNISVPLKIFRVHSELQHPPYEANYSDVNHAKTSIQQQYINGFRWEMRVDVGVDDNDIDVLSNALEWPTLLNILWHGHNENKHALYVHETLNHSNKFTVLHITDTHISQRNDQIPELLCQVRNQNECEILQSKYNNFNDNLRAFIKEANRRVEEGESVIVILTGDIVDYYFDGYWNGKFICGQKGQDAPDRRREATGTTWDYSNIEKFREIITGDNEEQTGLCCPIFTVLGNHDYYANEIPLNLEVNFLGLRRLTPKDNYSAFGLNQNEGTEYDFWAFPREDGKDHIIYVGPHRAPVQLKDSIAIRKTHKELKLSETVSSDLEHIALKNWKASLDQNWAYWLLKPKSKLLGQYISTVNYDLDYEFNLGNHHFLCLNTAHDRMPTIEEYLSEAPNPLTDPWSDEQEDEDTDYFNGGPHNRGITDEHIRLLNKALQENQEISIYIFTHAPLIGLPNDEITSILYEDNHEHSGAPPNMVSAWWSPRLPVPDFPENEAEPELDSEAKKIRWLENHGFPLTATKYFKSGNRDPYLNFSSSGGKVIDFMKRISRKSGHETNTPIIVFSGHTHKTHEFRIEKDQHSKVYYFADKYSEKKFTYTENAILLGLRYGWLRGNSPLLLASGALKNKNPQYREIVARGQSLASLEMKDIPNIEKTANFKPGCQLVALLAHNGQFVCAEDGGNGELVANRNAAKEWETFEIVKLEKEHVALKACNGKYVRAKGGGGGKLKADRHWINSHETFLLVGKGGNKFALRTHNGQYVCAEGGGGRELVADRNAIREWETFELVELASPYVRANIQIIPSSSNPHVMTPRLVDNFTYTFTNNGHVPAQNILVKLMANGLTVVSNPSTSRFDLSPGDSLQMTWRLKAVTPGNQLLTVTASGTNNRDRVEFYGKSTNRILIEGEGPNPR
jgi:hypothetical protein